MEPRVCARRIGNYTLDRVCGSPTLLVWAAAAGVTAAAMLPGTVLVYAYVSPGPAGLLATLVASLIASIYASCAAYVGARWMLPQVIYALSFYYIPAAITKAVIAHDPLSAASAAVDSLLLAAAGLYEEKLVRGKSGLLDYLAGEARDGVILSALLGVGAVAAALAGHPRIGALAAVAAGYLVYSEVRRYFENSVWGWSGAPVWEKAAATGLLAFYASLAAALLLV